MEFRLCANCGRQTGHQRKLGFGTLFAVICTLGWWLLAIPFYPKRCTVCGTTTDADQVRQFQQRQLSPQQILAAQTKQCPQCAESIKFEALKCRYCGEQFDPDQVSQAVSNRVAGMSRGALACQYCGEFGVVQNATLPDGGIGPWCPRCQKPAAPRK